MQNLFDKASLVMVPSGYDKEAVYNIKPDNKNSAFKFERGSFATRLNKDGIIEYVGIGEELASNNTIVNAGGGVATIDGLSVSASSDGTASSSIRPKIEFNNLVNGEVYIIKFSNIVTTGTIGFSLYNGSSYEFNQSSEIPFSCIFTKNSGSVAFIAFNGNNTFTANFDISLKQISNDTPRIDYSSGEGALLLEPSRTNNIRGSEIDDYDFGWRAKGGNLNVQGMSKTASYDPELGSLVFTISESDQNEQHRIISGSGYETPFSGTKTHAISFLIKGDGIRYIRPLNISGFVDLQDGTNTVEQHVANDLDVISFKSEMKSNGYVKIEYVITHTNSTVTSAKYIIFFAMEQNSDPNDTTYLGDPNRSVKISQIQIEEGTFPTSYIPGTGTLITRNPDLCYEAGDASLFNDSEGVLYAEIRNDAFTINTDYSFLSVSDGSTSDRVSIGFQLNNNKFYLAARGSSADIFAVQTIDFITGQYYKIAIKYKNGDNAIWINGVEVHSNTATGTITGLDRISFNYSTKTTFPHEGNLTKAVCYFPEILTDEELQRLTSTSEDATTFTELADNNSYTIL